MKCWRCGAEMSGPRCPRCGAWAAVAKASVKSSDLKGAIPVPISAVAKHKQDDFVQLPLAQIWKNGVPRGAVILLGGHPGAGKSTLALQLAARFAEKGYVLYATAEETVEQIRARAERVDALAPKLFVIAEHNLGRIFRAAEVLKCDALVVDSVQMVTMRASDPPGSPAVIREVAAELVRWAQRTRTVVLVVSQAPKRGGFAGPRLMEHIVDCALYIESPGGNGDRVLRVAKNRYGPTAQIPARMTETGLTLPA